jgi:hypothetical protein
MSWEDRTLPGWLERAIAGLAAVAIGWLAAWFGWAVLCFQLEIAGNRGVGTILHVELVSVICLAGALAFAAAVDLLWVRKRVARPAAPAGPR